MSRFAAMPQEVLRALKKNRKKADGYERRDCQDNSCNAYLLKGNYLPRFDTGEGARPPTIRSQGKHVEKEELQKFIIWLVMVAVFMVTSGVLLVLGY